MTAKATQRTERGQTAVLGFAILLFIAVALIAAVVGYGLTALNDGQAAAGFQQAEQSMTVLDARSDRVAFEDGNTETVDFGATGSGVVYVRPDDGRMRVMHNFTPGGPDNEILYDRQLGAVRYFGSDRTVAYQGGGVFRYTGNQTVLVANPEVETNDGTLMAPVIRINGSQSAQGDVQALIASDTDNGSVYPNVSESYSDGRAYTNPINRSNSEHVEVVVTSEFYRGWERHFERQTNATVTTFHDNDSVRAVFHVDTNASRLFLSDATVNVTVR
jgi:hypothetical protein